MATSNLGSLAVYLTADTSNFRKGLNQAEISLQRLKNGILKISAAVGAGIFLKNSMKSFIDAEEANNKLANSLLNIGANANQLMPKFQSFASELQKLTTYDDEEIKNQMAYALNLGITEDKLQDATKAAMGLATKLGVDLSTAFRMLALAQQGNVSRLTRYGIAIDENLSKQEKFNSVLNAGIQAFSMTEAAANTTGGKLKQLSNSWGELQEAVGANLIQGQGFASLLDVVKDEIDGVSASLTENANKTAENRYVWASMGIEIIAIGKQIAASFAFWGGNAIQIISNLEQNLFNLFTWTSDNWSKIWANAGNLFKAFALDMKNYAFDLWDILKGVFKDIGTNLANLGKALWNFFTDPASGFNYELVATDMEQAVSKAFKGSNLAEAMNQSGLSDFVTVPIAQGLESLDALEKRYDEIEKQRIENQAKLYENSYKAATSNIYKDANKKGLGQEAIKQGPLKFAASITKGSEADYKASINQMIMGSKSAKTKTETNTENTVSELKKLNQNVILLKQNTVTSNQVLEI